jgi:TfoX/Sxy family transcriptional regulator of competence genes
MSYYELPKRLYDEREEAAAWARTAYEIAARSPNAMRKARRGLKEERPRQTVRRRQRT